MSGPSQPPPGESRLGVRLVAAGLVTQQQLDEGLRAQRQLRGSLGYHLLRLGKVSPQAFSAFVDEEVAAGRLPAPRSSSEAVLAALPARLAQLYNAYPLARDGQRLVLALPPHHGDAVTAIGEATGLIVEPLILSAKLLREAVERDYLGAAREAVQHPAAGLTRFVVDDGEAVRPVAPSLRTDSLSPEVWLRSVLAEAIVQGRRQLELSAAEPLPLARARGEAVTALIEQLAHLPPRSAARDRGRFLLQLRGRRPVVDVVRDGWHSPRLTLHLAEQRYVSEDPDDLFAGQPEAQAGVEAALSEERGLLLVVAASGGGGRRLLHVLGRRLAEVAGGAAWIGDGAPDGATPMAAGADDESVANGLHEALATSSPLVVAEELRGSRSFERALLAASRAPVLAGFVAADAPAALAWIARQGLSGALKVGLLRGIVAVLGADEACIPCSAELELPPAMTIRWGLPAGTRGMGNAGCAACLEQAVRRTVGTIAWTPVAGRPEAEFLVDDEEGARRALAARGEQTLLARVVARADADLRSAAFLLQAAP